MAFDNLYIGQLLEAKVVEQVAQGDLIVEYGGDLLRVKNRSEVKFRVGEKIHLKVMSVKPISFQLNKIKRKKELNISI